MYKRIKEKNMNKRNAKPKASKMLQQFYVEYSDYTLSFISPVKFLLDMKHQTAMTEVYIIKTIVNS